MRIPRHIPLYLALALPIIPLVAISCTQTPSQTPGLSQNGPTIKDVYKGHFLIGTAADVPYSFTDTDFALLKENFEIITPENYLKPGAIHPTESIWTWQRGDALVDWCAKNHIMIHGHTLAWHAQTNAWFFEGGDKATVSKRLENHIKTLVGRYKGKIYSWDVVNEAIADGAAGDGENLRASNWTRTIGPEFLTLAFKWAHEADPDCKLYYNDYGIENGNKHKSSLALVKRLKADGAPIYGIGIQGHWNAANLPYAALDQALTNYAELGLKVSISELDITLGSGTSGGQLNQNPGGAPGAAPGAAPGGAPGRGGRGRGGAGPAPAGAMTIGGETLYFAAAPGGGGVSGSATSTPATDLTNSVQVVTGLTDSQKGRLATVSSDLTAQFAAWQTSSQETLAQVQPQYSAGQLAYDFEVAQQRAVQAQQNQLRDGILNAAEVRMNAILTPAQGIQWETARLNAALAGRPETASLPKAQADAIVADFARRLATASDKGSLLSYKAAFWRNVLAQLDDVRVAQVFEPADAGGGRGGRGGRGPTTPTAQQLKQQADAYARLFVILEKHKNTVERVTFWGLNDRRSWRASESPLFLDVNNQRKPAYEAIVNVILHPELTPPLPPAPAAR
jgi:GH35 family endo-1,4-beta-xylanase